MTVSQNHHPESTTTPLKKVTTRQCRPVLSSDSGLSSIVNQSEQKDSDSEISEINGLKRMLIQDIDSIYQNK